MQNLHKLNNEDLKDYENLINNAENPDLIKWLIEKIPPPIQYKSNVLMNLINYAQSDEGKNWFIKKGNQ